MACLGFLDFFSITAQRNALAITANCCQVRKICMLAKKRNSAMFEELHLRS